MPDSKSLGQAGLTGWRVKVADRVAPAVAQRTSLDEDAVRAAVGGLFFALSVYYVASTLKRMSDG